MSSIQGAGGRTGAPIEKECEREREREREREIRLKSAKKKLPPPK